MCSGLTRVGLPSFSAKEWFIDGIALSACTIAYPMRWVKETLPAPGALEVVVDDDAVVEQQLHRDRAHRGGGRHLERAFMFLATAAAGPLGDSGPSRAASPSLAGAAALACGLAAGLVKRRRFRCRSMPRRLRSRDKS